MTKEKTYRGIPASHGISMSKAYFYARRQVNVSHQNISEAEIDNEINGFNNSVDISLKELKKIYSLSVERIGEQYSRIFLAQLEILNDTIFINAVKERIKKEKKSASYIFYDEITKLSNILLAGNDYMKERYVDVNDVKNRVIRNMKREKLVSKVDENTIIFAHELTPADTILFSRRKVLGYATDTGGTTSHTAIISRALRIPAVVGMKVISKYITTGDFVIIDGYDGVVIVNPREETIAKYREKTEEYKIQEKKLSQIVDLPCQTADKKRVEITSNLEFIEEVDFIKNCGNCGIGLYRTEHLFMAKDDFPSLAEQIDEYSHIANVTFPKTVTVRTFDLGGDKLLPGNYKEANPNLGWRGIRVCLDKVEMFKEQLKAILLSSGKKNIRIMFPMISSIEEVRKSKQILKEVKKELEASGGIFDKDIKIGVMIEVPSAVVLADAIAKEVNFFSIGTNDLTQYLLAVDRGNELISGMFQEFHPAVIKSIKHIVDAAHKNKIKVSICGEMASNARAVPILVGLDMDELSVNPTLYPEIKQALRLIKYSDAKELVSKILSFNTLEEIKNEAQKFYLEQIKSKIV
jgi:phosphoenolpyruvate-protein phosphotransferase (PTS system enzyme I)